MRTVRTSDSKLHLILSALEIHNIALQRLRKGTQVPNFDTGKISAECQINIRNWFSVFNTLVEDPEEMWESFKEMS